jgi:formate dehydrogenase subunit gamma
MNNAHHEIVDQLIASHRDRPGPLLPVLHEVQDALGYIPTETVPMIAAGLNLSRAEVHGVISYYHHFRSEPPAPNVIKICRAEACQARGSEALARHAQANVDGDEVQLETVYCLGLCASGPAIQINETQLHANLSADKFDTIVADLEKRS